jgi:hypothetical protein
MLPPVLVFLRGSAVLPGTGVQHQSRKNSSWQTPRSARPLPSRSGAPGRPLPEILEEFTATLRARSCAPKYVQHRHSSQLQRTPTSEGTRTDSGRHEIRALGPENELREKGW